MPDTFAANPTDVKEAGWRRPVESSPTWSTLSALATRLEAVQVVVAHRPTDVAKLQAEMVELRAEVRALTQSIASITRQNAVAARGETRAGTPGLFADLFGDPEEDEDLPAAFAPGELSALVSSCEDE